MNTRLLREFAERVARRIVVPGVGLAPLAATGCGAGPNPPPAQQGAAQPQRDPEAEAVEAFGREFVDRVKQNGGRVSVSGGAVTLAGKGVTDADLGKLAPMKGKLRDLNLSDTAVTLDGLAQFRDYDLHSLELPAALRTDDALAHYLAAVRFDGTLNLSGWAVTDAGLRSLAGIKTTFRETNALDFLPDAAGAPPAPAEPKPLLAQLTRLNLSRTQVTNDGVSWLALTLANFPPPAKIRDLDLSHTKVGDAGLVALSELDGLRALNVEDTKVTDAGLASLPPGLVELDLSDTAVTDAGTPAIARLKKLETLSVSGTRVSDTGMNTLVGVVALRYLMVAGSRVTPAGTAHFNAGRPGAEVDSHARTAAQRRTAVAGSVSRGGFGGTGGGSAGS